MINNLLKNFCLITFALIAPITLPAGGIQKSLNQNKFPNNTKEIILSSHTPLYSFPQNCVNELFFLFEWFRLITFLLSFNPVPDKSTTEACIGLRIRS